MPHPSTSVQRAAPLGRIASVGLLAVLVLVAAGCGRGARDEPPIQVIEAAAATTEQAGSARMRVAFRFGTGGEHAASLVMEGVGSFDGDLRATAEFEGTGVPGGVSELIVTEGTMYVRGPLAAAYAPRTSEPGQRWVAVDAATVGTGGFGSSGSAAPEDYLAHLRQMTEGLTQVGREEIRGTPTTHYRATVPFERFLRTSLEQVGDELPDAAASEMIEEMVASLGGADLHVVTDAWIDDDDLLRRLRLEFDLGQLLAGADAPQQTEARTTIDFELWDYGVDVDVEAPPAEQVVEVDLGGLFGTTGSASASAQATLVEGPAEVATAQPELVPLAPTDAILPDDFPVHPELSRITASGTDDGTVEVVFVSFEGDFQVLRDWHERELQVAGWQIPSSEEFESSDGERSASFDVRGHGRTGTVTLDGAAAGGVTVTVRLGPVG